MKPLISFILPSHNRVKTVKTVLKRVSSQDYCFPYEIIVVDNDSHDNTVETIRNEFPHVRVFHLEENLGAKSRNIAIKECEGDYIVMLDDDSCPVAGSVDYGLQVFENDVKNRVGCIAFNIKRTNGTYETAGIYTHFTGCGAMFRRNIFEEVGYYPDDYLYYVEEYDLSCRIWNAGYKIVNFKELEVIHLKTDTGRNINQILCQLVRNNMLLWNKYLPKEAADKQISTELWRYEKIAYKEGALEGFDRGLRFGRKKAKCYTTDRRFEISETSMRKVLDRDNIEQTVKQLSQHSNGKRVLIFCVGKLIHSIISVLNDNGFQVMGIVDDNVFMHNDHFMGVPIFSRNRLRVKDYDCIMIGSSSLSLNDRFERELQDLALGIPVIRMCHYDKLGTYLGTN